MDLLKDNIRTLFFKYFRATIFSSMIMTIYSLVDTICIGKYEGSDGTAAVACIFPLYSLMFASGLLFGVGGAVYMSQKRGAGDKKTGDKYFTVSLIAGIFLSLIIFVLYNFFPKYLLGFCGAEGVILDLSLDYIYWIAIASPLFLIGQLLILFIRNDGSPMYTTIAAISGGIFNIFGDIFFVFGLDMGIKGAGLATAIGTAISFVVLVSYFFRKKCTLKLDFKELKFFRKLKDVIIMGGSNFAVDIAMGLLAMIFNRQIMHYLGGTALGVYGVVSNLAATVQTFGYAVGESAQAVISVNFGAGKNDRIKQALKYAGATAAVIGVITCIFIEIFPVEIVKFYMTVDDEVLKIAAPVMRTYFTAMIFLVFNVFSTYYFQAISKPAISMAVSLLPGVIISGAFLLILPAIFGGNAIWFAVPLTELIVFFYVLAMMKKHTP